MKVENLQNNSQSISNVSILNDSIFNSILAWLEDKIVKAKEFVAEKMSSEIVYVKTEVKIGSPEKPIGITIFDQITGEPYCVGIKNGEWVKEKGECNTQTNQVNQTDQTNQDQIDIDIILN